MLEWKAPSVDLGRLNTRSRLLAVPVLGALASVVLKGLNYLIGERLGRYILPAQQRKFSDIKYHDLNIQKISPVISTHDGVTLDSLLLLRQGVRLSNLTHEKVLIYFCSSDNCYQNKVPFFEKTAVSTNSCALLFNYRGVNQSTGKLTSGHQLIIDGVSVVRYLLQAHEVKAKNIYLIGKSLGAAVAVITAYYYKLQRINLNVYNITGFSSLSMCIYGMIRSVFENPDKVNLCFKKPKPALGYVVATLFWPFITSVLKLSGFEFDVVSAYLMLDDANKEYIVVRSPKCLRQSRKPLLDDLIIHHSASLHMALKSVRRMIKMKLVSIASQTPHDDKLRSPCLEKKLLTNQLTLFRKRKMLGNSNTDGHKLPLDELKSRSEESTAYDHLLCFINR